MHEGYRKRLHGIETASDNARTDRLYDYLEEKGFDANKLCMHSVANLDDKIKERLDISREGESAPPGALKEKERAVTAMKKSIVDGTQKEKGIGKHEAAELVNQLASLLEDFNWQEVGGRGRG